VLKRISGATLQPVHSDKYACLLFCTSGTLILDFNGQKVRVEKNSLLFSDSIRTNADNFRMTSDFGCWLLLFTMKEALNIHMHGACSLIDIVLMKNYPCVNCSDAEAMMINDYFVLLSKRMQDVNSYHFKDIVRSLFSTLMQELTIIVHKRRLEMEVDVRKNMNEMEIAKRNLTIKFFELVEQSNGRIRTIVDFAKKLNVSPDMLRRSVMSTLDHNPRDDIRFFTMSAINQRLVYTDMTTQQIAYDLNFYDASMLCKYMKENFGVSPLEYRKTIWD